MSSVYPRKLRETDQYLIILNRSDVQAKSSLSLSTFRVLTTKTLTKEHSKHKKNLLFIEFYCFLPLFLVSGMLLWREKEKNLSWHDAAYTKYVWLLYIQRTLPTSFSWHLPKDIIMYRNKQKVWLLACDRTLFFPLFYFYIITTWKLQKIMSNSSNIEVEISLVSLESVEKTNITCLRLQVWTKN